MQLSEYARLASQVRRQSPELQGLDAQIAAMQPAVDAMDIALDLARDVLVTRADDLQAANAEWATAAHAVAQLQAAAASLARQINELPPGPERDAAVAEGVALVEQFSTASAAALEKRQQLEAAEQLLFVGRAALSEAEQAARAVRQPYNDLQLRAGEIRAAIEQCEVLMAGSGLTPTEGEIDEQLRSAAADVVCELIKVERDRRRVEGGAKAGAHWFKSTDRAVGEYTVLLLRAQAMSLPDNYVLRPLWRTMKEGVEMDMTPALARQILAAGVDQVAAIDDASKAHQAAARAAADPSTYDFTGGWPPTYQEENP